MSCEEVTSIFLTHYDTRSGAEDFKQKGKNTPQSQVFRKENCSPVLRETPYLVCAKPYETPFYWYPPASQGVWSYEVCFWTFKCFDYWRRKPLRLEHFISWSNLSLDIAAKTLHESQNTNLLTTTCRPESSPVLWVISSFKCVSSGRLEAVSQVKML